MEIKSNSHLLTSLTSLVDANQRHQQNALVDEKLLEEKLAKDARVQAREIDRQGLIQANRDALKKVQEKLRADRTEQIKANLDDEDQARINSRRGNLNLRESPGGHDQPEFSRPGQIVDIRI